MREHIVVGSTDLTPYIVDGSYAINSEDSYESWNDGNMNEHRIIICQKIRGSFDVLCAENQGGIALSTFLNIWNNAQNNGLITLGVYVPSINRFIACDCYYDIKSKEHIITANGDIIDTLTITIKEK